MPKVSPPDRHLTNWFRISASPQREPTSAPCGSSGLFLGAPRHQLNFFHTCLCGRRRYAARRLCHLRVHTAYSLSAGAVRMKELAACARRSACRRSRSPTPAICSVRSNSPRPAAPRVCNRSSAARSPSSAAIPREAAGSAGAIRAGPDRAAGAERGGLSQPAAAGEQVLISPGGAERAVDQPPRSGRRQRGAALPGGRPERARSAGSSRRARPTPPRRC